MGPCRRNDEKRDTEKKERQEHVKEQVGREYVGPCDVCRIRGVSHREVLIFRLRALGSMDTMTPELEQFLDSLSYPTQKWQITTCADFGGVDVATRRALYGLPGLVC